METLSPTCSVSLLKVLFSTKTFEWKVELGKLVSFLHLALGIDSI